MEGTRRYFFAAGLSGLLLALAYPGWQIDLGWLVWIGFVPLLWTLAHLVHESVRFRKRHGFLLGFTAGLIYFLIIFRWFWSIYPLDTFGIENKLVSALAVGAIYIVSAAGMAVFWGLAGTAIGYQLSAISGGKRNRLKSLLNWLAIPAIFVIFEYLRSWGFGFLWAGSGSLFGPHWTMGNLAYVLASNILILKLASVMGIYGVSFLIVLVNLLLAAVAVGGYQTRKKTILAVFALVPGVLTVLPYLIKNSAPESNKKINYAIVQTAQPTKVSPAPQEMLAGFKQQLELLNRVAKERPESELIVFPEASDFFKNLSLFLTPAQAQNYFGKLFKEPRLIISGGRVIDAKTGQAHSRVFALDTQGDIIGFYDKRLLAPGGEFLPYPIKLLTYLFSKNKISVFNEIRDLSPGQKEVSTVGFRHQFNIAPLICSELISPSIAHGDTQNSDVIVSMASYGVFHGNRVIADQMLAVTRFRAAENAKPVITAANLGRSYIIDGQGNVVFLAPDKGPEILTGSVGINNNKAWYNKVSDLPILLASLLLMTSSTLLMWFRRSGRP